MFFNFFKFVSVVFLLIMFQQNIFAQTTLIDPAGDGGFENGSTFAANGWTESSSANNPWVIGTVPPYAAGNSAYVSNDGGTTYTYNNATPCLNFYYRDVTVPAGETIINLSLNWISNGEASWDLWQVFTAPTTVVPVGVPTHPGSGTSTVPAAIAGATFIGFGQTQTTVQTATYTLPASLAGTTFRLIFSWKSDTSVGTDPPASMDNISLISRMPITPAPPITFTATTVTTTSMDIGWTDNSTDETFFRVYRSSDNVNFFQVGADIPTTSGGTTGTLYSQTQSGLLPGVTYFFRISALADLESAFLTGSQATLAGGSITSNGTGGGLWSATTTWTGGVVPTATDDVTILNGDVVTLDATGLVCNNLTVGGGTSGTLEYQATPLAGLAVNGNLTVAAGGTFSAGTGILATHTLSIGSATGAEAVSGDLVNHGTFDLNTTAGVTTTFLGLANTIISGTGSTPDFWAITVNKGTTRTDATLDVLIPITMSLVTTSTNRLVITNGTFKISSATDITPAGGTQNIIAAGGRLWLNHASAIYNGGTAGSPTIIGELRIDAGTFNYGSGNNTMTFSSTVPGGVLTMNGGTINFLGAVAFSSAVGVQFNMSGGNFNVDPQATNLSATATTFSIGTSTAVNWSGGVVTIIDPRATAGSTSFSNFSNTLNNKFITGGKLRLGDGTSTASGGVLSTTSGFAISASGGVWDLEIDNRTDVSTSRMARITGTTIIRNILEVKVNAYLFLSSGTVATNTTVLDGPSVINNGTMAGTEPGGTTVLGTFYFRGLGPQSLTGSGTFTPIATMNFYNLGTAFSREDFVYSEENDLWNQQAELSGEVREMRSIFVPTKSRSEQQFGDQMSTITLANVNPWATNRINGFSGNMNTGSNFSIGTAVSIPIVQIGSGIATDPGGTFSTIPTFNNVFGSSTYIYSIALGSHTTGAYNEMPAGPQTWTQVLINDVDGLFLDRPVTVNSTMTMTSGNINTTSTNIMTYVATTAITALATSYINGPFARVIPASQVAGLTLNYPVGKDTLKPMFLVDPITNADGLTVISAEVFEGNSGGTPGTGMLSLNTNRYFNASIVSGDTNLISTKVRLTEAGLTSTMGMGKSETVNGAYNLVSSAVPSGGTITSDNLSSLSFFAIGERDLSVTNPTNVSAAAISSTQINVAFTPSGGNNVVIVWNLTGTFSAPVGAPPAIGETFAGGTLLSNGITSPVNHTGLTQNTLYYYKAFSYDGTDYSLGVDVNATTPFELPYSQDFNAGTTLPPGWSVVGFFVSGNHGTTGSNGLTRNFWSSAQTGTARTPFIGPATADAVFEFDYRIVDFSGFPNNATVLGAGNFFNFQVSTDNTTWTTIHTIDNTNHVTSLSFAHKILDLSAYAGSIIYVRVSGQWASGDYYLDIDNVQLRVQPTEPLASLTPASFNFGSIASGNSSAPANFTIQNIGAGTLTINSGGITITGANADQFALGSITYPINLTAGQSQVFTATFSPTSGGQKTASLEVVHNAAGSPSTSSLTGRGLPAGSLVEDFNGTTFPPVGWSAFNNDTGTKTWYRSTLNFNSAPASAGSDWESSTITNNDWLITPRLTVASGDLLTFYHRARSTFFIEVLHIKIGDAPDPNGTWTDLLIINDNTLDWKFKEIDLTAYAGQNKYIAFVNRGLDQFTIYVDDVSGPVLYAAANDLGVIDYAQVTTESIETEVTVSTAGMTRSLHQKDPTLVVKPQEFKISLKPVSVRFEEAATAQFEVTVKNFGTAAQNSYQIGWEIDGIQQTSVSNTDPIAPGAEQVIALSWALASAGAHATRAWTILGGDENAANDTSATIGFFVLRDNSKFFEGFEANLPPVPPPGWLTVNNDGGGTVGPWAAAPTVFAPVEGNTYIAANFSGANGFLIDDWLISPNTGANSSDDDTLSFWVQSPVSPFNDSLEIRVSTTGTDIADFTVLLAYINIPKGQWTEFKYALPNAATRYIAFRYLIYDGGPSGNNSDYLGLDAVEIFGGSGSATFQLSVNVADGWNMVSIPGLHPVDQNVNTWWAFRDPGANVFRYAGGYQSVTDAVPGIGYWMKHAGALTYNTGEEWPTGGIQIVAHDPIAGASGWNLFGGYELSVTAANVTTNPPGLQSGSIFQYSGGYSVATTIDPGYGYWIKLDAAGQIIIPETMAKGEQVEYFAEDWGKIILTDATGINYTLYAVKGEVNLDNYELPPAPPAGMFDIRFSSGRIAEDINSSVKTIDMSGVTYPLTVRVEGMDVRLMDESGKAINVNLKTGEDIVISDASVMKLMVSGELIPAQYALEQNYPNPFNPSTIIEFSLPENVGNVKLSIYNALGEKVAELVNTALTAGKYQYQWNASSVATGMYIYELRTDNFVSVKKMLLLK